MGTCIRRSLGTLTRVAIACAILTGICTPSALAQSAMWSSMAAAGGSWGTPTNWQGGAVPSGLANTAGFNIDFNAGASVTLDGDRVIGTIQSSSANSWSLDSGGGGMLTVGNIAVMVGPMAVNAPSAGVNFAKDGPGVLSFSNPSANYSGMININAGTLSLVGSGNYSINNNVVHLASGATLDVTQLTGGLRFGGDPTTRLAVNNGDLLEGTGNVTGGLKVKAGGTVYPGDNGVGGLSVNGAVKFEADSNWKVLLGSANASAVNMNNFIGANALFRLDDGTNMPIDGNGLIFSAGQTYDYIIASGTSNFDIGAVNFLPSNINPMVFAQPQFFSLIEGGGNLTLRFSPVPEPTFIMAVCFGAAAGYGILRRRLARFKPAGTAQ